MNQLTSFGALLEISPNQRALTCKSFSATFGELRYASLRYAAYLSSAGLKRGDTICLWLPDGGAWLQLLFAAAHIGILVVPISTRFKTKEAQHIVSTAKAKAIFVPTDFLNFDYAESARLIQSEVDCVKFIVEVNTPEEFILVDSTLPVPKETGRLSDGLCTFSTSGTTGQPKLAVHSQMGILRHGLNVASRTNITNKNVMLCGLSLYGVLGFVQMIGALSGGASCVFMQIFEPARAAQLIESEGITHFFGSDGMFAAVLNIPNAKLSSWKWAGFAEFAGMARNVVERAEKEWGLYAFGLYGSSECFALTATELKESPAEIRLLAGGSPISPEISFRIVDVESGATLGNDKHGELQIHGYNVMMGYLNNPQATDAVLTSDNWYRTGDLAYRQDDRFIYLSRLKDGLRLSGYLVDPTEIELFLVGYKGVLDAQVVGVSQTGIGDVAVAFVRTEDGNLDVADLLSFCKAGIANYKVPKHIITVKDYPRLDGPNGTKIQKNKLRELAQAAILK